MATSLEMLCNRVKKLCEIHGIGYNDLEDGTGLGKNSITNWPKAKSMPSGDRILKVANFFDVSVDYLIGNSNNPKSHKDPYQFPQDLCVSLEHLSDVAQEAQILVKMLLHSAGKE